MKLSRVQICNFRSIHNVIIKFDPRCRILVGINEAGKTNLLRALAMLANDETPKVDDVRVQSPNEDILQEAYVRFIFSFDKEERLGFYKTLSERVIAAENQIVAIDGNVQKTLIQLCDAATEGLYVVNILKPNKSAMHWKFPETRKLTDDWLVPTKSCPDSITAKASDGSTRNVKSALLVHKSAIDEAHLTAFAPADIDAVHNALGKLIINYVEKNIPTCIFWSHSENHLIPARLPLEAFTANPATCLPLKNAFTLAGINNIAAEIAAAKKRSNGMRNLLDRVAKKATRHIRDVWPDYKGIAIDLRENGTNIEASVNDVHNLFDFARRSDGFKRFIAFLMMVSVPTKSKTLSNVLILTDDPDAGMHPSGARYVRDELIRIAESNYVLYSTHSVFMIDRERIGRHIIVTKKDEVTTIQDADESCVHDEEVLYNALGFSFAEILEQKNIVFEGWRDKELFRVALSRVPAEFADLKAKCAEWGICHVEGVKDVRRVNPILELAKRECLIISDGDEPACEHQRLHQKENLYGVWYRYDELVGNDKYITAEDFLKSDILTTAVHSTSQEHPVLAHVPKYEINEAVPFLRSLSDWLAANRFKSEEKKEYINNVKKRLFAQLKASHISPKYYEAMCSLMKVQVQLSPAEFS